jgi:uncharacterized protein
MTSFNVAGLLHEPPGATRDARLRDHYVNLGPDVELAGPMDADLRFQRTNRGILVRGNVRAPIRRTCARCNDPYVEETEVGIEEEFLPTLDPETGAHVVTEPGDEGALHIDAHHEIALDRVFHDELSLTEPMHPLCEPNCPGLCVDCVQRLEGGPHDHGEEEIDPRLAQLAALLRDQDRNGSE